jgi:hypothetical protein
MNTVHMKYKTIGLFSDGRPKIYYIKLLRASEGMELVILEVRTRLKL